MLGMRLLLLSSVLRSFQKMRLSKAYAAAYEEWEASGDAELWDSVAGDGLDDEDWSDISEVNDQ